MVDTKCIGWWRTRYSLGCAFIGMLLTGLVFQAAAQASPRQGKFTPPAPINLAYLPRDAKGMIFIRPAAIFRRPGMDKYAAALNRDLLKAWKKFGLKGRLPLKIEDIEVIVGTVTYSCPAHLPPGQEGEVSMRMGLSMVRSVGEFDWLAALKGLGLDIDEVHEAGQTYYSISDKLADALGWFMGLGHGEARVHFFLPDRRTLVCWPDPIPPRLGRLARKGQAHDWARNLHRVENCLYGMAFSTSEVRSYPPMEEFGGADGAPFWRDVGSWAIGINHTDHWQFKAFAESPSEQAAISQERASKDLVQQYKQAATEYERDEPGVWDEPTLHLFITLACGARVERHGSSVHICSEANDSFRDVICSELFEPWTPPP